MDQIQNIPTPALWIGGSGTPPPPNNERVTENGDVRVTETGDIRVTS